MSVQHGLWRWIFAIMGHLGIATIYILRVNLSVAVVAMVNNTNNHIGLLETECGNKSINSKARVGDFNWDARQQGYILSSFFYGYLVMQVPGGYLAGRFGGKWVFGIGVLWASVLTIITPLCAKWSWYALLGLRVLEGVGEGVTFPAMHMLISQWVPLKDRSKVAMIIYSGIHVGVVLALSVAGILCDSTFLGGWPSVFILSGGLGVIWFIAWTLLVHSSPNKHPCISDTEKSYIMNSLSSCSAHEKISYVPWFDIWTSLPQWSTVVANFCNSWVSYMLLTDLPSYFSQVLGLSMAKNGFVSALPSFGSIFVVIVSGFVSDYAIKKGVKTSVVRKSASALGFLPCCLFLILAGYAQCGQETLAIVFMVLSTCALSISGAGFGINHIDIAPRFSGVLYGISNSAGTIAGCITPTVTGLFIENNPSRVQYRKVFALAAGISAFGGVFHVLFASGDEQHWNKAGLSRADIEDSRCLLSEGVDGDFGAENENVGTRHLDEKIIDCKAVNRPLAV